MANDLEMKLILSAMDRITAPLKKIRSDSSDTIRTFETLNNRLAKLHKEQQQISKMRGLYRNFQETQNRAGTILHSKRPARENTSARHAQQNARRTPARSKIFPSRILQKAMTNIQKLMKFALKVKEYPLSCRCGETDVYIPFIHVPMTTAITQMIQNTGILRTSANEYPVTSSVCTASFSLCSV